MKYPTVIIIAALVVTGGISVTARNMGTYQVTESRAAEVHTVEPGETLWGIARYYYPQRDPRYIVHQIRQSNNLETATLQIGQRIILP